ncbi:hypothetical protein B0A48_05158 [Cryoendolithus antarcticus]|uniref:Uncharacterized protein n=1 Tax=Cryoendolithus antarcticus TaxID=1507870 RepID=A0A1V8TEF7_9PEZI|nr:hypothetical protein B0A48_05158 [Cryoendolithus antarcticus]
MSSSLRLPALAFASLSIALSIAVLACSARTLAIFNAQHTTNAWLLPIWPNHFDLTGLKTLIGTSTGIVVLNAVAIVALFVPSMPASFTVLLSSVLSSILALVALIMPSLLNNKAPRRDTLQTWTCAWHDKSTFSGQQPPAQFSTLCHQTRFTTFTPIPLLLLQLLLLATAAYALFQSRRLTNARAHRTGGENGEMEKPLELGDYHAQPSFDTKRTVNGSPKSGVSTSVGTVPAKGALG